MWLSSVERSVRDREVVGSNPTIPTNKTDKHNSLKREIDKLDSEIDEAIYKLYGFSNEEIKTIENIKK